MKITLEVSDEEAEKVMLLLEEIKEILDELRPINEPDGMRALPRRYRYCKSARFRPLYQYYPAYPLKKPS